MNAGTYLEAFRIFIAEGMSYAEAREKFDGEALQSAIWDHGPLDEEKRALFDLCVMAQCEKRNEKDFNEQAASLMLAGWTSEVPNPTNSKDFWRQCQIMSLYWRAPSKRKGKPGRKYLSTNQAYNAMMKATK